nr:cutinase [Quercus suber]
MKSSLFFTALLSAWACANPVEKRQYSNQNTENQLTDGTPCRALTIIFARGTFESGNVGTLTGPPFFQAVANLLGSSAVAVQGVAYPADVAGFEAGGDAAGSALMANLTARAQHQCPKTKLVLSGYSQGAQLVHKAGALLTAGQAAFVNSVVVFGDPDNGTAIANIPAYKVLTVCHPDDNICQGGSDFFGSHLTYSKDAKTAAAFVKQKAGL